MEFTKGNWEVIRAVECGKGGKHIGYSVTSAGTGIGDNGTIARCINPANDMPKNKANANLIAAAPDMYEACLIALGAMATLEQNKGWVQEITRAILKALTKAKGG